MRLLSMRTIAAVLAVSASTVLPADARAEAGANAPAVPPPLPLVSFDAVAGPFDPECLDQARPRRERSRLGPLAWLFRYDRDTDLERTGRSFAFYLRSPLLSGMYGCARNANAGAKPPEPVDECAELTITTEALEERTIQVLLPQYEAKNVRRLRSHLEDRLRKGHVVTLIMTGGEPFSIAPDDTRNITAKVCRRGVWNE